MTRKPRNARIEEWDDERGIGNSLIVTLKPGWRFEEPGEHVRGFDTVAEARREVKLSQPCKCEACVSPANEVRP
jgi:hypothetical protein